MAIRFAAVSGLVLAAALTVAAPARAQGFFSFYEMSPRQIVGMLSDDGYELRGPMIRRGDVYVADVTSISGRPTRLIVSARDGRIIERFNSEPRWRHPDDEDTTRVARAPRDYGDDDRGQESRGQDDHARHNDMALGDMFNPPNRVYGNDSMFSSKPVPPAVIPDDSAAPKPPKHHVARKHKDTSVAKSAPDTSPESDAPKPAEGSPVAAVAPNPAPEPKKPDVQPVKPAAEAAPKPAATPEPVHAEVEKRATAEPAAAPVAAKPKVDAPRKKLNDLPVGTLD